TVLDDDDAALETADVGHRLDEDRRLHRRAEVARRRQDGRRIGFRFGAHAVHLRSFGFASRRSVRGSAARRILISPMPELWLSSGEMNLRQLEYFVQVAELGSFSRAARLLGIAQPALSRQVRALETDLRETLLLRNGRGV